MNTSGLINTHFQVGDATAELYLNRFNGFSLLSPAIAPSAARPGRGCMEYLRIAEEKYVVRYEALARNR